MKKTLITFIFSFVALLSIKAQKVAQHQEQHNAAPKTISTEKGIVTSSGKLFQSRTIAPDSIKYYPISTKKVVPEQYKMQVIKPQ